MNPHHGPEPRPGRSSPRCRHAGAIGSAQQTCSARRPIASRHSTAASSLIPPVGSKGVSWAISRAAT